GRRRRARGLPPARHRDGADAHPGDRRRSGRTHRRMAPKQVGGPDGSCGPRPWTAGLPARLRLPDPGAGHRRDAGAPIGRHPTAVEAACTDEFNIHGILATTYFVGPVVIVNGPIAGAIGMNSGVNALGQGNRANATIGRALQLVIRNVGGGRPGGVDRATLGNPGKYTFCFAEDEEGSPWEALSVERGMPAGASAVTLFAVEGPRGVFDQQSRSPE